MTSIISSVKSTIGPTISPAISGEPLDPILATDHPNLVAMYTMDNVSGSTLFDETLNSLDGTIVGSSFIAGKIGNAISVDGVSDSVALATALATRTDTVGAVSCWVFYDGAANGAGMLFWSNSANNSNYMGINPHDHSFGLGKVGYQSVRSDVGGQNTNITSSGVPLVISSWNHVVVQSTGSSIEIYVNGVSQGLTVHNGINNGKWVAGGTNTDCNLGRLERPSSVWFEGKYDMVRYFDRDLTQLEVTALNDEGAP